MASKKRLFISYSTKDREVADQICESLHEINLSPWMDHREILAGTDFVEAICNGLDDCAYVVLLASENALTSRWCRQEMFFAIADEETILLPVFLPPRRVKLPALASILHSIDLSQDFPQSIKQLTDFFQAELGETVADCVEVFRSGGKDVSMSDLTFRQLRLLATSCMTPQLLEEYAKRRNVELIEYSPKEMSGETMGKLKAVELRQNILRLIHQNPKHAEWLAKFLVRECPAKVAHLVERIRDERIAWAG